LILDTGYLMLDMGVQCINHLSAMVELYHPYHLRIYEL
jgi:hypothetical protein